MRSRSGCVCRALACRRADVKVDRRLGQRPEPGPFFETQMLTKDGKWIDVESRANQIYLDPHNPGLVLNCRDISDRKQAERRLRYS